MKRRLFFTVLLFLAVFLFWWLAYPHALSYQEQNQLFLLSGDYLCERLSLPGGLADYLGEGITQFFLIPWLGALLLAVVFVSLQYFTWRVTRPSFMDASVITAPHDHSPAPCPLPPAPIYFFSFIPSILLLWHLGDESVLLSYPVALVLTLAAVCLVCRRRMWIDIIVLPLLYWCVGPVAWLYVLLRVLHLGWKGCWQLLYMPVILVVANALLTQWPTQMVLWGLNYYRTPLMLPSLQIIIPVVIFLLAVLAKWSGGILHGSLATAVSLCALGVLAFFAVNNGFDADKYELIRQDYLIRNERWDDIIERAEKKVVKTPFWSQSVNLALAMRRQLAERQFDFFQSGEDALFMPMLRDQTSDLPTAEAFWHLGMVNSAQRYMFDLQESILNYRKSGRFTRRIAECMIVNGQYEGAAKQLNILKKTLFYHAWAEEAEAYLYHDEKVMTHPVWGRQRQLRYKDSFLYNYPEIDKMLGQLFMNNPQNKMALDYFLAQLLLKGDVPGFMQYLGLAQRYGGYQQMPAGYQDAVRCIQSRGNLPGSPYADYVKRMTGN